MLQVKDLIEVKCYHKLTIDYFQSSSNHENQTQNKHITYQSSTKDSGNFIKKTTEPKIDADLDWGDDKGDDDFDDDNDNNKKYTNNNYGNTNYTATPVDIHKIGALPKNTNKKYCEITYLGNFTFENGKKLCDNLICTKCDVKVSIFKNKKWDENVNYLFFRNNYLRRNKLEEKLIDEYGVCSYSCQCNWKSISEDCIIASKVSNWSCLGH